ncbi:MAG: hypothetical protein P4L98_23540 [Ancalomicrobiaceae bacterium]|nr:hypothetical protein [Ancalomicrobiaceae bacterium]
MPSPSTPLVSPLESIFRKVSKERERQGYAYVRVDRATNEIVTDSSVLKWILARTIDIYEVRLDHRVEIYDAVETVRIFATQEKASIGFHISVTARSSNVRDIVRALASVEQSPHERLMEIVREAIKRAAQRINAQGPDGLLVNILAAREAWQQEIERTVADKTGLEAIFIFDPIDGGGMVRSFTVRNVELSTRDAPHRPYPLTLTLTLEPNGQSVIEPLAPSDQMRSDRIRHLLGRQLPPDVTLYDLWYDMPRVESALLKLLSLGLRPTGFAVASLVIQPIVPPISREEQLRCVVAWKGRAGRTLDFSVEAVVRLKREETGRFDALNLASRQSWLQSEASRALPIAMHARDFEDLNLSEQATVSEHVVRQLREAARATGQEIDPVVANVLLPENKWLQPQRVEIGPTRYPTRNSLADAEFSISLTIQLKTLKGIINRVRLKVGPLAPNDFNQLIEDEIVHIAQEAAREVMWQTEAADYFDNFEPWVFPDDPDPTPETSRHVGFRLRAAISRALKRNLDDPEVVEVSLRRIDDAVTKIYQSVLALNPITLEVKDIIATGNRSAADNLTIAMTARARLPAANRLAGIVSLGGTTILERDRVAKVLHDAARQFLQFRSKADILGLVKGHQPRSDGTPTAFQQLSAYLAEQTLKIFGFEVELNHVEAGYSLAMQVEREREQLAVTEEKARNRILSEDIEDRANDTTNQRNQIDEHIRVLNARLLEVDTSDTERRQRLVDAIAEFRKQRAGLGSASYAALAEVRRPASIRFDRDAAEDGEIVPAEPDSANAAPAPAPDTPAPTEDRSL